MTKIVSILIEILLAILEGLTYRIGGSLRETLDRWPQHAPRFAVAPNLLNANSAKSLTGRGVSSLFNKGHTWVLPTTPVLVTRSFRKCEQTMHGTVHFGSVAAGVARMSSDGNTDMRGQPARPDISR